MYPVLDGRFKGAGFSVQYKGNGYKGCIDNARKKYSYTISIDGWFSSNLLQHLEHSFWNIQALWSSHFQYCPPHKSFKTNKEQMKINILQNLFENLIGEDNFKKVRKFKKTFSFTQIIIYLALTRHKYS